MSETAETSLVVIGDEMQKRLSPIVLSQYGGPHTYKYKFDASPKISVTELTDHFSNELGTFDLLYEYENGCNVHDELAGRLNNLFGYRIGDYSRGKPRAGTIFFTAESSEGKPDLVFEIGRRRDEYDYIINTYELIGDDVRRVERVETNFDNIPAVLQPGPLLGQDGLFKRYERYDGTGLDLSSYSVTRIAGLGVWTPEHNLGKD